MLLYKKGKEMAKDINEIIEEIKTEESSKVNALNEVQQMLYYHHKQVEMETLAKKYGIKIKK